jgi:hypothetical protein
MELKRCCNNCRYYKAGDIAGECVAHGPYVLKVVFGPSEERTCSDFEPLRRLEDTKTAEADEAAAKLKAIKQVLSKRVDCLCRAIDARKGQTEWYQGKKAGYLDALDLLDESLESIKIEL